MVLPAGYPISIHQIEDEFGMARGSSWPGAFYGKGGAPSSGNLSLSDFFGRSNVSFTPGAGYYEAYGQSQAQYTISCSQNAVWTWTRQGSYGNASIASGGTSTYITVWVDAAPGGAGRSAQFEITGTSGGVTSTYTIFMNAGNSIEPLQ